MQKEAFLSQYPGRFFLEQTDLVGLQGYLQKQGWLGAEEALLSAEKAGEGNMNCTLRLQTNQRSLIVKQSRPWVEKYPQIAAPSERVVSEARFYENIRSAPEVARWMPCILGVDAFSFLLCMEDLGLASDLSSLYQEGKTLEGAQIAFLADFLVALHRLPSTPEQRASLTNRPMRALNHEHIFDLPTRPNNGIDLEGFVKGLTQTAQPLLQDQAFLARVRAMGDVYLADGNELLHGDFYPGSWLESGAQIFVLDPEFAFFGPASFDVGVCLAHLLISQHSLASCRGFLEHYTTQRYLDVEQALAFAGIEIMRRFLGVAQLPLSLDISERSALLQQARLLVLEPEHPSLGLLG
ncbi:MAG: phosphotransferase [Myxococcales bacterium]|nr:phosphotransferase [Myxococcales bacterium]